MKRYIRASFDSSMPEWFKSQKSIMRDLRWDYNLATDKAKFVTSKPNGAEGKDYLTVYNLGDGIVYIPGVNEWHTININGRNRRLENVSKKKLLELAQDIAYIDLSNSDRFEKRERYQDPRMNSDDRYAGQIKGEDGEWFTQVDYGGKRDKSGYRIPAPEDRIKNLYQRYPEKLTSQLDALYDDIIETQSLLQSFSFKDSPKGYGSSYSKAYGKFGKAIDSYRDLLYDVDRAGDFSNASGYDVRSILRTIEEIHTYLIEASDPFTKENY